MCVACDLNASYGAIGYPRPFAFISGSQRKVRPLTRMRLSYGCVYTSRPVYNFASCNGKSTSQPTTGGSSRSNGVSTVVKRSNLGSDGNPQTTSARGCRLSNFNPRLRTISPPCGTETIKPYNKQHVPLEGSQNVLEKREVKKESA